MIGMVALAGIVIRNSVVLIDFIHHGQTEGLARREAIIRSVVDRTKPIPLTAGTTLLGNWIITSDLIFSGLTRAIIFGILTSALFTLDSNPSSLLAPLRQQSAYRPARTRNRASSIAREAVGIMMICGQRQGQRLWLLTLVAPGPFATPRPPTSSAPFPGWLPGSHGVNRQVEVGGKSSPKNPEFARFVLCVFIVLGYPDS